MLLLSAGGGAVQTWRDGKFVQEFAQNPAAMRVRGYSLEQIREIQAAPEAERGALLAKYLPARAPLGEEQERLLAELKPLLKEGQLLLREQLGQEQTAEAEAADYGIRLELKTGGGWVVQMPGGQSVAVSSAEAARRIREDLKQTKTQAEAEQYVRLVESWAHTAPEGVTREVSLTGDTVTTDGQTVTRTGRSGESQVEEVSAQALEELRREGRLAAEAAGNGALELAINGSNSVEFRGRVAEGVKELVQRLEINRSLHGPSLTFLHERAEADLKAGIKTGAITWEETRQAVGSLAEAFRPEQARSEEERALSERVQKVVRGEASETELRETLVELAVGDILGRRRDGSVMPAGSVTAALDAAVRSTAEVSQVKALGKFRTFLRAVRTYFRGVFRTMAAINRAKRAGQGQEFSALVDQLLGTEGRETAFWGENANAPTSQVPGSTGGWQSASAAALGGWRIVGNINDVKGYVTQFGAEIANSEVGQAALRQLRNLPDGFEATLDFKDMPGGIRGRWRKETGKPDKISIYAMNNTGTRGASASFIHEGRHAVMNARGINQETQAAEYMARAREYFFLNGIRPNAKERSNIRAEVRRLYPDSPVK